MSNDMIDTIRSSSSGTIGRAVSLARDQRLVLDSSAHPRPDALTNSEAFLAGISSCGVTLIEVYAQEHGVPLKRMDVAIEGVRAAADLTRFALELAAWGVDDPARVALLDLPPAAAWSYACGLLRELGAADRAGGITPHGRELDVGEVN